MNLTSDEKKISITITVLFGGGTRCHCIMWRGTLHSTISKRYTLSLYYVEGYTSQYYLEEVHVVTVLCGGVHFTVLFRRGTRCHCIMWRVHFTVLFGRGTRCHCIMWRGTLHSTIWKRYTLSLYYVEGYTSQYYLEEVHVVTVLCGGVHFTVLFGRGTRCHCIMWRGTLHSTIWKRYVLFRVSCVHFTAT